MPEIGTMITCPYGCNSTGVIVRVCDPTLHGNRLCCEVKITTNRNWHRAGDYVIWEYQVSR